MSAAATITGADAAIRAAERALAALHDRLAAGDAALTPDDLERAEAALRFARAQRAAAERAATERRERERLARLAVLRVSLPRELDPAPLERAAAKLGAAIAAFLDACHAHDDRLAAARAALEDPALAPLPDDLQLGPYARPVIAGREYGPARPQLTIHRFVREGIMARWPRRRINLNNPPD